MPGSRRAGREMAGPNLPGDREETHPLAPIVSRSPSQGLKTFLRNHATISANSLPVTRSNVLRQRSIVVFNELLPARTAGRKASR